MPYLMDIAVSMDFRLENEEYLFEYGGRRFKYVQKDPLEWADSLLTILPDSDEKNLEAGYSTVSEFLSALSWKNKCKIGISVSGGCGCKFNFDICDAISTNNIFPEFFSKGNVRGYSISPIPKIENDFQRKALTLYREATASNNLFLSFLFYWQILNVLDRKIKPENVINEILDHKKLKTFLPKHIIESLDLKGMDLGKYLKDTCRNAIAHISHRDRRRHEINLDSYEERIRIYNSTWIIKAYAEHFICFYIGLNKKLHLVERIDDGFPIYYDLDIARKERFKNIKIPYLSPRY